MRNADIIKQITQLARLLDAEADMEVACAATLAEVMHPGHNRVATRRVRGECLRRAERALIIAAEEMREAPTS